VCAGMGEEYFRAWTQWGDVVTWYLHCAGPGGKGDLCAAALVVGWGNRGHGVGRGGNI
jgi:hypothetical protein